MYGPSMTSTVPSGCFRTVFALLAGEIRKRPLRGRVPPSIWADRLALGVGDLLRLSFENGDELVRPHVTCLSGALIFREFAFG
jgi:hypothetical protein